MTAYQLAAAALRGGGARPLLAAPGEIAWLTSDAECHHLLAAFAPRAAGDYLPADDISPPGADTYFGSGRCSDTEGRPLTLSPRLWLLAAAGFCRVGLWPTLSIAGRDAVLTTEALADAWRPEATPLDGLRAERLAQTRRQIAALGPVQSGVGDAWYCCADPPLTAAHWAASRLGSAGPPRHEGRECLFDLVGNPFRALPAYWADCPDCFLSSVSDFYMSYLGVVCGTCGGRGRVPGVPWLTPTVRALAAAAYAAPDPTTGRLDGATLGVLRDALEEADCPCPDLMNHLRGARRCGRCWGAGCAACDHSGWCQYPAYCRRGCWALDRLLDYRR